MKYFHICRVGGEKSRRDKNGLDDPNYYKQDKDDHDVLSSNLALSALSCYGVMYLHWIYFTSANAKPVVHCYYASTKGIDSLLSAE